MSFPGANSPQEVGRPDTSAALLKWIEMIQNYLDNGMARGYQGPYPFPLPGMGDASGKIADQYIQNQLQGGAPASGLRRQIAESEAMMNQGAGQTPPYHTMPDGSIMEGPSMGYDPSRVGLPPGMPSAGGGGGGGEGDFLQLLMQLLGAGAGMQPMGPELAQAIGQGGMNMMGPGGPGGGFTSELEKFMQGVIPDRPPPPSRRETRTPTPTRGRPY